MKTPRRGSKKVAPGEVRAADATRGSLPKETSRPEGGAASSPATPRSMQWLHAVPLLLLEHSRALLIREDCGLELAIIRGPVRGNLHLAHDVDHLVMKDVALGRR